MCLCFCDCVLVLVAVLFPPLPVWIKRGLCSADSLINILLCCLGYFPGLLHSWYIISRYPEDQYIIFDEEQQLYIPPNEGHTTHITYAAAVSPSRTPLSNNNNAAQQNAGISNTSQSYGATNQTPLEAPPAYDHVIEETVKNSH